MNFLQPAALALAFTTISLPLRAAGFANGTAADVVLGQTDFTSQTAGVSAHRMQTPTSVAIDPVTGKMFVADYASSRILRFGNASSLGTFSGAEAVLGQINFSSTTTAVTQSGLSGPYGIHVDSLGRLWVADFGGNRVLMWEAAAYASTNAPADLVLGQPDFNTGLAGTTAAKMSGPTGVFVDDGDRLWVADYSNNRVLRFDGVSAKTSGASANGVLGQPDFVTSASATTAVKMSGPTSLQTTGSGVLWVADYGNNRVLGFPDAATLPDGSAADSVLGQPDFTSSLGAITQAGMRNPAGIAIDSEERVWVADYQNARVLCFSPSSGANLAISADCVVGQNDFTTISAGPSATALTNPFGLAFDLQGNLWVADYVSRRVVRFKPDGTPPALTLSGGLPKRTSKRTVVIRGTASDPSGVALIRTRVGGAAFQAAAGTTSWTAVIKLKKGRNILQVIATDTLGNTSAPMTLTTKQIVRTKRHRR